MSEMSTGRYLAETLKGLGVTHVFHVPHVFASAHKELSKLGITRVLAHHEIAAAYMADGYARAAHRPGICFAQQVGAANMAAGLRDAYLACSAVIAITGGPHPDSRYQYMYQSTEDFGAYAGVTKFNAVVGKPGRFSDLLRQAVREAVTGTPGPCHLELPGRLGEGAEGKIDSELIVEEQFGRVPPYRPDPGSAPVAAALRVLEEAERPVIVAGGGVNTSMAGPEIVRLAEKLNIPVVTSATGKGAIPEDHPLALGVVGSYGRPAVNEIVREADLVFFIACRAGDLTTDHYKTPRKGTPAIQLDINPAEIGRIYPLKAGLVGDAKVTVARLIETAEPSQGRRSAWSESTRKRIAAWRAGIEPLAHSDAVPIRPERLCREITDLLPDNAVLVADTGYSSIWTATMVELHNPTQRYIRCMGTLGWSLPGSLGVKCALPERPVLCFTGDGGIYYHLAELETAARAGINAVIIVNNNSSLAQEKALIDMLGETGALGTATEVYAFRPVNFARVAQELGCIGIRVEKPNEIRPALEKALAAERPVVVDVVTEIDAMPAWS